MNRMDNGGLMRGEEAWNTVTRHAPNIRACMSDIPYESSVMCVEAAKNSRSLGGRRIVIR